MSRIAVSVSSVSAVGLDLQERSGAVSIVETPSVVSEPVVGVIGPERAAAR